MNKDIVQAQVLSNSQKDWLKIEVGIRDVGRDNSVWPNLGQIQLKCLLGEQVNGNGVAAECVECQQIKMVRGTFLQFALNGETAIAGDDIGFRRRRCQVGEVVLVRCDADYIRIDLIKAKVVARLRVCGQRSNTQADYSNSKGPRLRFPLRGARAQGRYRLSDAARHAEVARRQSAPWLRAELKSVRY